MSDAITQAIIEGSPNISITISASDLKKIIGGMIRNEREQIKAENEANNEKAMLTRKEVMERLGVSESTVVRWNNEKYLVPVKVGRKALYKASEVNRLLTRK